jgi:nudix-type nucleoside diphosphatase (YffH/AdpP family)
MHDIVSVMTSKSTTNEPDHTYVGPLVTDVSERIRVRSVEVLSDDWYLLKKTIFEYLRRDGTWQTLSRETYDRGNGAVVLLYNRERRTVVLTRQFRYPAYVNGHTDGLLIEACAGLLDNDGPESCIQREVTEETGFHIGNPRRVFEAYMSPGSVTEKLFFYIAEYWHNQRIGDGGGDHSEGEDIEVLELAFDDALEMVMRGEITDGKTIMLLLYAHSMRLLPTRESQLKAQLRTALHEGRSFPHENKRIGG